MVEIKNVKKAIIPVAGLGTRMLPATKAVPKELLPILDKPLIQYILEEAITGGIEEIILVTRRGKEAIENHLDDNFELEHYLREKNKKKSLKKFPQITLKGLSILSIRQEKPLGLGHAIYSAKPAIKKNEPFAVLLPDEFLISKKKEGDFSKMVKNYCKTGNGQILVEKIRRNKAGNYGMVKLDKKYIKADFQNIVRDVIEKPSANNIPSNLRIVGRYIFPYTVMNYLEKLKPGKDNELQLTDAIRDFIKEGNFNIDAILSNSKIFDCGSPKGFIGANISIASQDVMMKKYMEKILK